MDILLGKTRYLEQYFRTTASEGMARGVRAKKLRSKYVRTLRHAVRAIMHLEIPTRN